ncbi:MAG: cytochrome c nitrite reductase small subunit [Polyangiales bacterium]
MNEARTSGERGGRDAGRWLLAASAALGVAVGIGAFTFRYAKGASYFSADPAACANCHIMTSQYDSWQKSSHHAVAVCIDCHLPHPVVAKYLAKAENGWRHSKELTAQTFHEPIRVQPRGRRILQDNCVTCHDDLTHAIAKGARGGRDDLPCLHCHAGVGHGERAGLGGPWRAHEREPN